jgi:uncharacterized protein (DUF885 family)
MRKALCFFIAMVIAASSAAPAAMAQSADRRFETLANNFIQELLRRNPETATGLGDHRYDNRLDDYSRAGRESDLRFARETLNALNRINFNRLNPQNRVDARILRTQLESQIFRIGTLREYEWNPLVYNIGGAVYSLVARNFAPLPDRLRNVKERLRAIPTVLQQARLNLRNPPRIHTETAILQNGGNINLIREELNQFISQAPQMQAELAPAQAEAVRALEEYGRWLQNDLLPRSTGDFRIGDAKFRQKLRFSLDSDLTKEQILQRAMTDLRQTQDQMYEVALPLHRRFFPDVTDHSALNDRRRVVRAVLNRLSDSRPTNDTIVRLANESMERTTRFVRENNIVTVPDDPVRIIVMPEFQRGVAVAYCDSAGPLERVNETFYAISPTPRDWTPRRVESFYREYNNYMVENLTVHEAMPGHYLQIAHSNRFRAPTMIRAIFGSGTFTEGWATYAEQVMVEQGYGGPEVRMQQLKMRLRLIINAILDQKVHTENMTEREAMDLMMNEGFQEEGEAAGKWRRAALTSTQLSTYYVGNIEMNDIRRAYMARAGRNYNMKTFHDALLSFGSPSPKYARELMGL